MAQGWTASPWRQLEQHTGNGMARRRGGPLGTGLHVGLQSLQGCGCILESRCEQEPGPCLWNLQQQDTGLTVEGSQEVWALSLWEVLIQAPEHSLLEGIDQMGGCHQVDPHYCGLLCSLKT